MSVQIDVVIPSFRLEEHYLLPILSLKRPADTEIRFFLVADNPAVVPSPAIQQLVDNQRVFLSINPENLGAARTRNKAMEMGNAEWILFLDDDITVPANLLEIYAEAIRRFPKEIGFIGLVNMPPPHKAFSHAIVASGSMDIFKIAKDRKSFAWGATANMMISRVAMGDVRFSEIFPKAGGGEDVDFFMNIRERNNFTDFKSLPEAAVEHPWWNNEASNFKRPFRYGMGNSWLPQLNPKYAYHDFPNTIETVFLALITGIAAAFLKPSLLPAIGLFIGGVVLIEIVAGAVQSAKRRAKPSIEVYFYLLLLRLIQEAGMFWGNISRGRLVGITERFNYNGSFRKTHFYRTNTYKLVKWVLYPLLVIWIWRYTSA
ncbi:glycosyltransferase family 2 protein [Chitinophaga barathri]|uniref:Glycosyltransferase n=1 Tax=Chitinophaga barathri TaxID=1647451 RepID=A0A3N4M5E2_9BACT|nr:glycosyltransferase [Chitinophaga barathri]RPD38238.1 glycosyltransferase [Chitinophaga barathri]